MDGVESVIIRAEGDQLTQWQQAASLLYQPNRMVFAIPSSQQELHPALADKQPATGPVAYICHGNTCSPPLNTLETLAKLGK